MPRTATAQLSEYELKRQEQIAKNQALLRNLALDAASAGLAPSGKAKPASAAQRAPKKKTAAAAPAAKKEWEDSAPRRTSSRLRGLAADGAEAKRKAESEHDALAAAERAKRQRVGGDLRLGDIAVGGRDWDAGGNFLRGVRGANPYERTFTDEDVAGTSDKALRALRERMSGLALWEDFEPNELKITPERIYSLAFHPTVDKPLVFAGDKLGNLGICDCSPTGAASKSSPVKKEEPTSDDEDEEEEARLPNLTIFKPHARTITALQFSPGDATALYTASYDSSIRRLDLPSGLSTEVYAPADPMEDDPLSAAELHPTDPHVIYFSTLEGRVGRHDVRTPSPSSASASASSTELFALCDKKIGGFALHPRAPHLLATASLDRTLKLWDLRRLSGRADWRTPHLAGEHESRLSVSHVAFSPRGVAATSSYDDTVKLYDFSSAAAAAGDAGAKRTGGGTWPVGRTLSPADMSPSAVVPHNNQTGRWVTILKPLWQARPPGGGPDKFAIGNMNRFVDVYAEDGAQLAQLGGEGVTAVPAVAALHPGVDWVGGGTASGKLCLWV